MHYITTKRLLQPPYCHHQNKTRQSSNIFIVVSLVLQHTFFFFFFLANNAWLITSLKFDVTQNLCTTSQVTWQLHPEETAFRKWRCRQISAKTEESRADFRPSPDWTELWDGLGDAYITGMSSDLRMNGVRMARDDGVTADSYTVSLWRDVCNKIKLEIQN